MVSNKINARHSKIGFTSDNDAFSSYFLAETGIRQRFPILHLRYEQADQYEKRSPCTNSRRNRTLSKGLRFPMHFHTYRGALSFPPRTSTHLQLIERELPPRALVFLGRFRLILWQSFGRSDALHVIPILCTNETRI